MSSIPSVYEYFNKRIPYRRRTQKPGGVVGVNMVCNSCRRVQFILQIKSKTLLCLIVIRVDNGLCLAETYAPLLNKIIHIPICKSKIKTEHNLLHQKHNILNRMF